MKVIFICYNYLTLYKTMFLVKNRYSNCNCFIIYRETVAKAPKRINEICNTMIVNSYINKIWQLLITMAPKLKSIINVAIDTQNICNIMKNELGEENILVVFKDNEIRESTIIEQFVGATGNKVILVEEGLGLYNNVIDKAEKRLIYKIIYKIFCLSNYSLKHSPQGLNPHIKEVMCCNPELFKNIKKRYDIIVDNHEGFFNKRDCIYFVEKIVGIESSKIELYSSKYVYITQPLSKDGIIDKRGEIDFEERVINSILKFGKVLIKKHPRDNKDYNCFVERGAKIFNIEYSAVPFECLYNVMECPIIFTVYSSVYKNILDIDKNATVVLLYKLIIEYIDESKMHKINQEINKISFDDNVNVFVPNSHLELCEWLENN